MANRTASIVVRGTVDGKRVNWSLKRAKQQELTGTFWVKWRRGDNQTWDGPHKDEWTAKAAKAKREREFKLIALGVPISVTTSDATLKESIAAFILERTASQDASSVRRWKWELNRFATITGKTYLRDIDREDVFAYWNSFKADGAKPRTIHNRIQSLLTFLKNRGITGLLKTGEMPAFDEKDVDYYTENNPTELTQFFSECNSEERLAFMFFLYSGCREREVMFACWNDIDFINRTYTVRPKRDLGFRTKNGGVRAVPLPQVLIDALKTYVLVVGSRRLIFVNSVGGAQGHFLYKCKQITFRAGLNCGHCINKQGKSCAEHAVCANWGLHKFRRTWATMHLLNGMPMPLLQNYIGHSDMQTLHRYLARISAKSDLAKQLADNMAKMAMIQGTVAANVMAEAVKV
jgi:integrase